MIWIAGRVAAVHASTETIPPGLAIWRASLSQYSRSIGLNVFHGGGTTANVKISPAFPQTTQSFALSCACSCQADVLKVTRSIMMAGSLLQIDSENSRLESLERMQEQ